MKKFYPLIVAFILSTGAAMATGHTVTPTVENHVTCPSGSDGRAYVTVSGGVGPFTFSWNSTPVQTTDTLFNVPAGNYICQVTDQSDMSVTTATVTINNGTVITASSTGAVCDFGTIMLYGNNSTVYNWAGPNGFTSNLQNPVIQPATQAASGTYTLTGTSTTGCVSTSTVSVFVANPVYVNVSPTTTCNNLCNGMASAYAVGGMGGFYTYNWNNGSTSQTINNLCAGNYNVTVVDQMGCMGYGSTSVYDNTPVVSFTTTNPTGCGNCDGGVQASVSGGSAPYTYMWSPNNITTQNISGLCPGTYILNVTDAQGCSINSSVTLASPTALSANITFTPDTCGHSVGAATANVSNVQGPVTYLWQPGNYTTQSIANIPAGVYTLLVQDTLCSFTTQVTITNVSSPVAIATSNAANCGGANGLLVLTASGGTPAYQYSINGGAFSSNQTYNNISPGTYTIICQDAAGCNSSPLIHTVMNSGISIGFATSPAACGGSGGSSTAYVSGGNGSYTYLWSNGATTQVVTGLSSGTYTCTVTDGVGCTTTGITTVTSQATLYLSYDYDFSNCGTNSITANPNFGTGSYTYSWMPGGQTTQTITNLQAGGYTCTVTDANGCTGTGVYYIYPGDYSIISGNVYADLNNNCTLDAGETSQQYMYIVAINSGGQQVGWASTFGQSGAFQMYLPSVPATYTLSLINPYSYNYGNVTFNCNNNIVTLNSTCDTLQNMNLGYAPVVGQDLTVHGYCGIARPGFLRSYQITYGNPGTITTNATVKMQIDPLLTFAGSTPPATTINGNTIEWNVGNLPHGMAGFITVSALVPTIQNGGALGTILHDSVWIEPLTGDNYITDNSYACSGTITGSYDPNMKEVFAQNMDITGAIDTSATDLYYTVHFQNTGTDTAFTIVVHDTISPLLDLSTLEIIAASHNYTASILPNRTLQVKFDNILLVDSNRNEALSHGYFHYKIHTRPGLQAGDQINNTAAIYFDFNDPVFTNTVETPVQLNTVGVKNLKKELQASVWPNPAGNNSSVKIRVNDASFKGLHFVLYNSTGVKVGDQAFPEQPVNEFNTSGLPAGIYLYQLQNAEGKIFTGKIIIAE